MKGLIFVCFLFYGCLFSHKPEPSITFTDSPRNVSDLRLWLRSDIDVYTTGANVTHWYDQSGNRLDATQSTAGKYPTYVANVINASTAVVRFDGISQFLITPSTSLGTEITVFVYAARPWAVAQDTAFFGQDSTYTNLTGYAFLTTGAAANGWAASDLLLVGNGNQAGQDPRNFGPYGALVNNTFHVITGIIGANNSNIWVDGTAVATGQSSTSSAVASTDSLRIGSSSAVLGDYFDGDLAEVIIYNRALTEDERKYVECYLSLRYQLTSPSC